MRRPRPRPRPHGRPRAPTRSAPAAAPADSQHQARPETPALGLESLSVFQPLQLRPQTRWSRDKPAVLPGSLMHRTYACNRVVVRATRLTLHRRARADALGGERALGTGLRAFLALPQPHEASQWELFIPIPISPVRKPRLGGTRPTAQGPTAEYQSWALNPDCRTQEGFYSAGSKTRKTERGGGAVLQGQAQEPEAQAELFQDLLCCQGLFRENLSVGSAMWRRGS